MIRTVTLLPRLPRRPCPLNLRSFRRPASRIVRPRFTCRRRPPSHPTARHQGHPRLLSMTPSLPHLRIQQSTGRPRWILIRRNLQKTACEIGSMNRPRQLPFNLQACIVPAERAITRGCPRHRIALPPGQNILEHRHTNPPQPPSIPPVSQRPMARRTSNDRLT